MGDLKASTGVDRIMPKGVNLNSELMARMGGG